MGPFNGNAETVTGWLNWYAGDNGSFGTVTNNEAHSGSYSQELFKPDTTSSTSEIVYYSIPHPVQAGEWYKVGVWVKTSGVNFDGGFEGTYTRRERLDDRLGITYFFHSDAVLDEGFSTSGGDKFVYVDQTTADSDWTLYEVAEQATEDATGISVRARFTSSPTGTAYFDDYTIKHLIEAPGGVAINEDFDMVVNPSAYSLNQNYPNPFNPSTTIGYSVPQDGLISVDIYNVVGQKIKTLYSGYQSAGSHSLVWDATNASGEAMPTGIYIYSLNGANAHVTHKMVLIR